MKTDRIVVTGLGVVSSLGLGWRTFWEALQSGQSGISDVTSFDTTEFSTHRGGEVRYFDSQKFISPGRLRRYSRASQFAIAGSRMALEDASIRREILGERRVGMVFGTTMAGANVLELIDEIWVNRGVSSIPSYLIAQYPGNTLGAHVAAELGIRGTNLVLGTACAAGNYALSYAYDMLRLRRFDLAIAGGVDAFSRVAFMGFNRLFAVAPVWCQPFDRNRKGMIPGEGAGVLILERLEDAVARGAHIHAEMLGYGMSCDANHMTIPAVEGLVHAMRSAIDNSGVAQDQVDYISAHGTGTPTNDRTECAAIKSVFGERARSIPISSIKSMIGHTMGAASALEAIACALSIEHGRVPPTINYEVEDPECDIDCVPNVSREHKVGIALNNSFAFGGNNAAVVLAALNAGNR